jgi:ABC-type transport system involved in multi-copper enzyme maturation permease subunit
MMLPVVHRELQAAARRRGTHRLRFWLAFAMLGMWLCLLRFGQSSLPTSQQGQSLFRASGLLALGFSLLAGAFLTADCLSEEKREGTLGLLFLTELKGYDVVLGKLIATSLHGFYGVLAVLPLLGLPLLMGSVTAGEFWRIALTLAATLLLSLSIGLLVSALWLGSRQTMTLTLAAVLLVAAVPPGLGRLASSWTKNGAWQVLSSPSPPYLFWAGLEANYSASAFWTSFCTIMTVACGALVFPSFYAPRAWRETGEPSSAEPFSRWQSLRLGSTVNRLLGRSRLDENPFYWLAGRDLTPRWTAWCLLTPLFCVWACSIRLAFSSEVFFELATFTAFMMHQVLKYLVTVEATRRLSDERRSGAIEPLLVTPLSEQEIVAGQERALVSLFAWPAVLVLATNLVLCVSAARLAASAGFGSDLLLLLVPGIGGAAILFFDFHALSLVGMWLAVKVPGHRRAVFGTLARVMLGPWLAVSCLVLIRGLGHSVAFESIVCWLGVSTLLDLMLANWAREELMRGLRDHPPQSPPSETTPGPGFDAAVPLTVGAGSRSHE